MTGRSELESYWKLWKQAIRCAICQLVKPLGPSFGEHTCLLMRSTISIKVETNLES